MNNSQYRKLTVEEQGIIERLLEINFPARDALSEQISNSNVMVIDENGSLKFKVLSGSTVSVKNRIPVEAEYEDMDGITVHILLHVVNGAVQELEIYKDDSSLVVKKTKPDELRILHWEREGNGT